MLCLVEATILCQQQCLSCPTPNIKREGSNFLVKEHWEAVRNSKYVNRVALFNQGESLLHRNFGEIVRCYKDAGMHVLSSTNGMCLEKWARDLAQSKLDELWVCIDGLTQETHSAYRQNSNLEQVLRGVRRLVEMREEYGSVYPKLVMQFILFKSNEHELGNVEEFAKELGFDELHLKTTVGNLAANGISREESGRVRARTVKFRSVPAQEIRPCDDILAYHSLTVPGDLDMRTSFCLNPALLCNGVVAMCCHDPRGTRPLGKLGPEASFDSIVEGRSYFELLKDLFENRCSIKANCPSLPQRRSAIQDRTQTRDLSVLKARITSLVEEKRFKEGLSEAGIALELDPSDALIAFNFARCLRMLGRSAEAVEALRKAIDQHGERAGLLSELSIILRQRPETLGEAVERAKAAVQLEPNNPWMRLHHADALTQAKRTAEAEAELREAVALRPPDPVFYRRLASCLLEQQRYDEADNFSVKALEAQPEQPDNITLHARCLRFKGKGDEALTLLQPALDRGIRSAGLLNELSVLLRELGKNIEEALAAAQEAVSLEPGNSKMLASYADCLELAGRSGEAETAFRKALECNPHDEQIRMRLVRWLKEHNREVETALEPGIGPSPCVISDQRTQTAKPNTLAEDGIDLLKGKFTFASIEVTTKCNLRCVYCYNSTPGFHGAEMDSALTEKVIDALVEANIPAVALNAHGETTTLSGWTALAKRFHAAGMRMTLVTNLAKKFTQEEIEALRLLGELVVSLDTHDPELLRRTRRGVTLGRIMENLGRIREQPGGPRIRVNCVLHNRNLLHIDEYVRWCVESLGVKEISFCNLCKREDIEGAYNVDLITALAPEDLEEGKAAFRRAEEHARANGAVLRVQGGLKAILE